MADLRALLRLRCGPPAWALFEEVGDHPSGPSRFADAVAVSLYRSRGIAIHGFERKDYRGDWLRELKQPGKSDPVFRFCNYFWLVAQPDVAQPEEIPDAWGWLAPDATGKKLAVKKKAPLLQPDPPSVVFVAALLRRASQHTEELLRREFGRGREDGIANGPKEHERRMMALKSEVDGLKSRIAEFEQASGITFETWDAGRIGEAVKLVRGSYFHTPAMLAQLRESFEKSTQHILKVLDEEVGIAKSLQEGPCPKNPEAPATTSPPVDSMQPLT
jgi:hypothetical protein